MLVMCNSFLPPSFSGETAYRNGSLVILWSLWCMSQLCPFFLYAGFEDIRIVIYKCPQNLEKKALSTKMRNTPKCL